MNRYIYIITCLILFLTSCTKEEEEHINSKIIISEQLKASDNPTVSHYSNEYVFQDNQLIMHIRTHTFNECRIQTVFQIIRESNNVTITDTDGYRYAYSLNEEGYASSCHLTHESSSTVRDYTFTYSNGYLNEVVENINNEPTCHLSFSFDNGNQSFLTIDHYASTTECFTPGEIANTSGLPCIAVADMYPLSFHSTALYAGLLGKPSDNLVSNITFPDGNNRIDYKYKTDTAGRIVSCTEQTTDQGYIYNRTISYAYE